MTKFNVAMWFMLAGSSFEDKSFVAFLGCLLVAVHALNDLKEKKE